MRARYYVPGVGRFASADTIVPDPIVPQSLNRYSYAAGNPVKLVDPSGYAFFENNPDDPHIWRSDRPTQALARAVEPVYMPPSGPERTPPSASYDAETSFQQGSRIGVEWLMEVGPSTRYFGPDDPLTQDLMYDFGVEMAFREYAAQGYPPEGFVYNYQIEESGADPWGVFVREQSAMFLCMIGLYDEGPEGDVDMIGPALGSYYVYITDQGDGTVEVRVYNQSGWASFSRIPGTDWHLKSDVERSGREFGGGTTEQWFVWTEPKPR